MGIFVSKKSPEPAPPPAVVVAEEPETKSVKAEEEVPVESTNEAPNEDVEYCEKGYQKLQEDSECHSLLKKHLTKEVLDSLKAEKTSSFNSSLRDVIQSGVENLDSGIGVYAPDAQSYIVFALLFDPIIEEYHGGFSKTDIHPESDFGDPGVFDDLDPEKK